MICPNCKTDLVEVNGRYICSDCGREIPENEVMASDWGNGGTVRAGLYGAGTDEPEAGTIPVAEYNTSLTESEGEIEPQNTSPVPIKIETTGETDELTVEEVLQSQQSTEPTINEAEENTPVLDTGFYAADSSQQVLNNNVDVVSETTSVIPSVSEESLSNIPEVSLQQGRDNIVEAAQPVVEPVIPEVPVLDSSAEPQNDNIVVPEVAIVEPVIAESVPVDPVAQEIPITVSPSSAPETIPEVVPEHTEVVKDMFENTVVATAPDPGIYTDPMYETSLNSEQGQDTTAPGSKPPLPVDKRMNLIVVVAGSLLTLLLIIGGTWGYLALSKKTEPIAPVVIEEQTVWQELQSVDGGFKISFPDQPETVTGTQTINDTETAIMNYEYQTDDIVYMVSYAQLTESNSNLILGDIKKSLPKIVTEVANTLNLEVSETKIGKYYNADSIDFALSSDTSSYQGKLMINGQIYILVLAGSESGQSTEYDKFVKSFGFIAESIEK